MATPGGNPLSVFEAKREALIDLQRIPGVGPSIAHDLWDLGVERVGDLRGRDPEALYDAHCARREMPVDNCMRYVFRCAVYFATEEEPDPALLRWWSWKGRESDSGTASAIA
ncbi:MAG TPA: helix-hairpin-helix domain-containing protein [Longimicrobiales bacterium]|nr:helix-hairpin-helix domain-containing protein [Longimicrobiales bacterium]